MPLLKELKKNLSRNDMEAEDIFKKLKKELDGSFLQDTNTLNNHIVELNYADAVMAVEKLEKQLEVD